MRCLRTMLLSGCVVLIAMSAALGQEIIQDISTGFDAAGTLLGDAQPDGRYLMFRPGEIEDTPFTVPDGVFPIGPWLANSDTSRWIGPNAMSANGEEGLWEYDILVTLTAEEASRAVVIGACHQLPQFVSHAPRGFVCHAQLALQFLRCYAVS